MNLTPTGMTIGNPENKPARTAAIEHPAMIRDSNRTLAMASALRSGRLPSRPRCVTAVLLVFLAGLAAAAAPAPAERFLGALEAGDFDAAHAMLAPATAAELSREQLEQTWQSLPEQLGAYRGRGAPRRETIAGREVHVVRLEFAGMALDARIVPDATGAISGFRLLPAAPGPADAGNADAADGAGAIRVAGDLPGLVTLPPGPGPFPGIVLVHGSGPNDRDETIGPNKPFRDIAEGLAGRGIAAIRYDKRTRVFPEAFEDRAYTVDDEVIADALAAVDALRQHPDIDPGAAFVVGHSLGAMLAPRIAARAPELAGIALLAAPARPLHEVVPAQVRHIAGLDGEIDGDERAAIERLEAEAARVAGYDDPESSRPGLLGLPESWLLDLRDYDPVATAGQLALPMFIAQGGRDYQVTVDDDFARWQAALGDRPGVRLEHYPRLDHLFIAGQGMATPREYLTVQGHVDEALLDDLAAFIHRVTGRGDE